MSVAVPTQLDVAVGADAQRVVLARSILTPEAEQHGPAARHAKLRDLEIESDVCRQIERGIAYHAHRVRRRVLHAHAFILESRLASWIRPCESPRRARLSKLVIDDRRRWWLVRRADRRADVAQPAHEQRVRSSDGELAPDAVVQRERDAVLTRVAQNLSRRDPVLPQVDDFGERERAHLRLRGERRRCGEKEDYRADNHATRLYHRR